MTNLETTEIKTKAKWIKNLRHKSKKIALDEIKRDWTEFKVRREPGHDGQHEWSRKTGLMQRSVGHVMRAHISWPEWQKHRRHPSHQDSPSSTLPPSPSEREHRLPLPADPPWDPPWEIPGDSPRGFGPASEPAGPIGGQEFDLTSTGDAKGCTVEVCTNVESATKQSIDLSWIEF